MECWPSEIVVALLWDSEKLKKKSWTVVWM